MGLTLSGCECTIYFQIVQNVIHSCFTAFSALKGVNHWLLQWKPAQASKHLRWHHCHQKQHPGCFPSLRGSFPSLCLLPLPSSITLWSATIFPSEHTNIKHTFDLWQPHTAAGTKPNLINNGLFPLKCFINVWLHILTTCFLYNQLTMLDVSWTKATLPASPHFFFSKIVFQEQKLPDQ